MASSRRELRVTDHSNSVLLEAVKRAAATLTRRGVARNDRVIVSVSDPRDFASWFLAAQCVGAIPVPVPSFAQLPRHAFVDRVASVVQDSEPRIVLIDDARASDSLRAAASPSIELLDVDTEAPASRDSPHFSPDRDLGETALLQYTSGSTGSPKGVVVLHYNLVANLRAFAQGTNLTGSDVLFSWLPLYHDMGLVAGFLLGIYLGLPTNIARPSLFSARPEAWLKAMTTLRATFCAAPNFAFHWLAERRPADLPPDVELSRWRIAINGSETVSADTIRLFLDRYRRYGLGDEVVRPGYGLAEATLACALVRPNEKLHFDSVDRIALAESGVARPCEPGSFDAVSIASVGAALPGHRIEIWRPGSKERVGERVLGEIVVLGPSVTPGYFRDLRSGASPWTEVRTGDLGYLSGDQVFVVDRIKDILVLSGRNLAPADLERVVERVVGIRTGATVAFSSAGRRGTEELVIVASPKDRTTDREQLRNAVQRALHDHVGVVAQDIVFAQPGVIPRTSSGKVRRSECKRLFESGALHSLPET